MRCSARLGLGASGWEAPLRRKFKDCWKMLGTGHGDRFSNSLAEMEDGVWSTDTRSGEFIDLSVSGWAERGKTVDWSLVPGGRVFLGGSVDP